MSTGGGRPLALLYGTRPQVIKASVLAAALRHRWPLLTVDTGQHYDYDLHAHLYEQLDIARPDVLLGVGSGPLAHQTAAILERTGEVLEARRPWAAMVIGDTNSTLGCALAAAQLRIPVVHVEAGLRAHDTWLVEEINRRVVDALGMLLCAPSPQAAARLARERPDARVAMTGDVACDVLMRNEARAPARGGIAGWPCPPSAPYVFSTLHRAQLTADALLLGQVIGALGALALPVVFAAHPRTRAAIDKAGIALPPSVHLIPPLGYLESLAAIRDAGVVVTDSGGVQREAYWLGTPCITVRSETEWSETVALGANETVAPAHAAADLAARVTARLAARGTWDRGAYGEGAAATRICDAVAALARELAVA